MPNSIAAMTMVKDDLFFLRTWIKYYSNLLGKENLYVVNHGRSSSVATEASGCNVIGIPEGDPKDFDRARWKLLNSILSGIRNYYSHVIIGDVDELVVLDPRLGLNMADWIESLGRRNVLTPLCLEIIHHPIVEPGAVDDRVLGPRRYVRTSMKYSKPCVVSTDVSLSRGGHFATHGHIDTPDDLFLFHLKYCDFQLYTSTTSARNILSRAAATSLKKAFIGRHWFEEFRRDDKAVFEAFSKLPLVDVFDMLEYREKMRNTFAGRGDSGFFQFDLIDREVKYQIPERFFGVF